MRANKRDSCFSNFRTVVVFLAFNATIFVLVAVGLAQTWFDELPVSIRAKVLWSAGHETSNMHEWTMPQFVHAGGGIFNTGEPEVIAQAAQVAAHSGQWSAQNHYHKRCSRTEWSPGGQVDAVDEPCLGRSRQVLSECGLLQHVDLFAAHLQSQ